MRIYKYVEIDGKWVPKTKVAYQSFIRKNYKIGWSEREPEIHEKTPAYRRSLKAKSAASAAK